MKDYNPSKPKSIFNILMLISFMGGQCRKNYQLMVLIISYTSHHGFKWLNNLTNENLLKLLERKDTNIGYIFEVDLEYPKELWKSHSDYPLTPEKLKVDNVEKLIGCFYTKHNNVFHHLFYFISFALKNTENNNNNNKKH